MDLGLTGKTALVTGASKGIGFAVAEGLAAEGCNVIITSSNAEHLESARVRLAKSSSARIGAHVLDLRYPAKVARTLQEITRTADAIDILIFNGPGPMPTDAVDVDAAKLKSALDTTLASAVELCHSVLPRMTAAGFGRIVFLASSTAKEPDVGMIYSNVARAGVIAYAKTLSREAARHGITVNSILTGSVLTERTDALLKFEAEQAGVPVDRFLEEAASSIPAGYICPPSEFAKPIVFLCSSAAAYVNGISLPIDGGYMRGL